MHFDLRRWITVLITLSTLIAGLGVSPARAQVTITGQCTYYAYVPMALANVTGGTSPPSSGHPVGFTPPDVDFNGDGYADVAIGVPREDVDGLTDAGAVNILYGAAGGLTAAGNQLFTQKDTKTATPEAQDKFGYALAAADFDGNGCTDLAVGAPEESITGSDNAGAVYVVYGSRSADGLDPETVQNWYQGLPGLDDAVEAHDFFGYALGTGDFNSDGYGDLVIGVPFEAVNGQDAAGAVHVIYGTATGLTTADSQWITQDAVHNDVDLGDLFGSSFASGDFDGDGYQDLAISAPSEDNEDASATDAGGVHILFGSDDGLSTQIYSHLDSATPDRHMGSSLAAGDFNADGYTDLATGSPAQDDVATDAGRVTVWNGVDSGVSIGRSYYQTGSGAEEDDHLGAALTVGDYNSDGVADLVIGIPGDNSTASSAGALWMLYGVADSGLPSSYDERFDQDGLSEDAAEADDEFASSLTSGDYDGNGSSDLVIGVPREDLEGLGANSAGAVEIVYSTGTVDNQFWTQATPGVEDDAEALDFFGQAVR